MSERKVVGQTIRNSHLDNLRVTLLSIKQLSELVTHMPILVKNTAQPGEYLTKAELVEQTLTDGSKVHELRLS